MVVSLTGCGSDDPTEPAVRLDGGVSPTDAGGAPILTSSVEVVDGLGSEAVLGDPLDLVVLPSGRPAVVYGAVAAGTTERTIRYAERRGADDWVVETAVTPGAEAPRQGDLLALSAGVWDGAVQVAYLGGDDDGNMLTPFPTDLVLATRTGPGTWAERVLVDTSGEAVGTCPDFQNYCNFGNVVGSHAALAVDGAGGWAAIYRDTHGAFADDDFRKSDVELYRGSGGAVLVDPERGGGAWGNLAFLPGGGIAAAYQIESAPSGQELRGIWVAVPEGTAFRTVKVASASTTHRLGLVAGSDGTLWLAWYDASAQDLVVARSSPPWTSWSTEAVDRTGSTGLHPDLALGPEGRPYVVYGYCGPVADRSCPGNPGASAEVRLARRIGESWRVDVVDDGEGRGGVGFYNRIGFLPDGRLAVAWQDLRNSDVVVAIVEEVGR